MLKIPLIPTSRMKIVQKLTFGYLTLVLIMAVVAYYGVNVFNRADAEFDKIADQTIPIIGKLQEIKVHGMRVMVSTSEFCFVQAEKEAAIIADHTDHEHIKQFPTPAEISFSRLLSGLEDLTYKHLPGESAHLEAIKKAAGRLEQASMRLMNLKKQGVFGDQVLVAKQIFVEADQEFMDAVNQALDHENEEFQARKYSLHMSIERAVDTIVFVGLATFIVAILLGFFISRELVLPILKLQDAAAEIGKGKLDTEINIDSDDEFGSLAETFRKMAADLKVSLKKEIELATASSAAVAAAEMERKNALELREMIAARDREISERKRAEEELKNISEKIKIFAYSVSHDLKNPAIAIHGLAKLLDRHYGEVLTGKGKRFCEQIIQSSEQIAELVETIKVYITTKETPLNLEPVSLGEICRMVRDEFSVQLNIRRICLVEPEVLPEIVADRLSVLRLLRNLIDNALKYGGEELTEIRLSYEESDAYHVLSVMNDGAGLEKEECDKIFGVFKRVNWADKVEGTGLGLAIVKEIAEQHGGRVWVESGPQRGITFHISISRHLAVQG